MERLVLALVTAACVSPVFAADSPEEILAHVRRKYQEVKDAELSFTRRTRLSVAKIEQNATGSLLLKKGHKYRIEMDDRTVVTDGTTVWSYSKANNQVTVDAYRPDERALTPERILAGAPGDFAASLLGREKLDGIEMVVLKLVPRGEERSAVTALKLWIDPEDWLVRKAELAESSGKETTYTVNSYSINSGIPDSRFTFTAQEGTDVIDLR